MMDRDLINTLDAAYQELVQLRLENQQLQQQVHLLQASAGKVGVANEKHSGESLGDTVQRMAQIGAWEYDIVAKETVWSSEATYLYEISSNMPLRNLAGMCINPEQKYKDLDRLVMRGLDGTRFSTSLEVANGKGHSKWLELIGEPVFNAAEKVIKLRGTLRDITDAVRRKHALDLMIESLDDLILEVDNSCTVLEIWARDESVLLAPKATLLGRNLKDFLSPNIFGLLIDAMGEARISGVRQSVRYKLNLPDQKQSLRWFRAHVMAEKSAATQRYSLVIADITEEVELENREMQSRLEMLKTSNELQQFFNICADPLCIASFDACFVKVNPALCNILGYSELELTSRPFLDFVHFDDINATLKEVEKLNQGMTTIRFENRYRCKDGSYRILNWASVPDTVNGRLYAAARDMTDDRVRQRELEAAEEKARQEHVQALHNAKLASLGQLAAGLAHEINNPLTIIISSAALLPAAIGDAEQMARKIASIQKAGDRIAKIIKGMKKFSRRNESSHYKMMDLAPIIKEVIVLTSVKARHSDVLMEFSADCEALVFCDEIEMEQVFVNLINNGIDAAKNLQHKWLKINLFENESSVILQIRDSGIGIDPEVKLRLFQPFFTTKPAGEGTGLGVPIVKGILEEHGATIEVLENESNTCFEIRFPKSVSMKGIA